MWPAARVRNFVREYHNMRYKKCPRICRSTGLEFLALTMGTTREQFEKDVDPIMFAKRVLNIPDTHYYNISKLVGWREYQCLKWRVSMKEKNDAALAATAAAAAATATAPAAATATALAAATETATATEFVCSCCDCYCGCCSYCDLCGCN